MIISLTGFMGCGKTTVGRALASRLGWEFFDLDEYLEHKWDCTVPELFSDGELRFRAVEAEALRDLIIMADVRGEDCVIALGGGTISNPVLKELILGKTTCIWLKMPLRTALDRIGDTSSRPLLAENNAAGLYERRIPDYSSAHFTLDAEELSPEEAVEGILGLI